MLSFYPGPSKIYPEVKSFMMNACDEGILSVNHRSDEFVMLSRVTIQALKEKLCVPDNFWVFFATSATECWEIISQSFTSAGSFHLYNGSFGEKWFEYASKLSSNTVGKLFDVEEELVPGNLELNCPSDIICLTQNETSNGTQVSNSIIKQFKEKYPEKIIAVDATSSMGGVALDFSAADIWFASVQKCFGLPAGLAVIICSPQALEKAEQVGEKGHYNSFLFMKEKMEKWQTTTTPNVLGIYLLGKVMEMVPAVEKINKYLQQRRKDVSDFLAGLHLPFDQLIENECVRSDTVICLKGPEDRISVFKDEAKARGILFGNGYGNWQKNTFRIANFPALSDADFEQLKSFFKEKS